ncbi:homeobox protein Mohawk, partial [Silurus asotus]
MNPIVFNKLSSPVLFEEKASEVERSSRNYLEVIDEQHADLLSRSHQITDSSVMRHRRPGSRPNGGKVRHKRQALQDMARPLKQWLYKHRDNPYPTKTEKILLALGSQMTLVQSFILFPSHGIALNRILIGRIVSHRCSARFCGDSFRHKVLVKSSTGVGEKVRRYCGDFVEIHSDTSVLVKSDANKAEEGEEDGDPAARAQTGEFSKPMYQSVIKKEGSGVGAGLRAASDASLAEDYVSPPKYKSSLLHRYLNDSLRHVMVANGVTDARRRNHSGSFSSNEYDEDLLSPSCSETEANFVYRTDPDCTSHFLTFINTSFTNTLLVQGAQIPTKSSGTSSKLKDIRSMVLVGPGESSSVVPKEKGRGKDETYWREINAAMALTNLAKPKDGAPAGTTSCIIQKSSHIAEIKTVKVPIMHKY